MIGKDVRAHGAARSARRRGLEWLGHRSAELAVADRRGSRPHRGRRPEAQIEVGVRHSRRVRVGIAGHRRRLARVRRQPQRRLRARHEDRLSGVGVRGRCRRAIDACRRSRSRREQHAVLRRRARAGVRARRQHRSAAMEGESRGAPRRDDHRRRGVSQRTALRAGVIARRRHGGDPDVRMLHVPRQRGGARRRERQADLEDLHDSSSAAANDKDGARHALWGPSGGAVWSQPSVDAERNRIYISTGDAFEPRGS